MQAESSTAGGSSSNIQSTAEAALPSFARGVVDLLQTWSALRMAVTHNWKPAQAPAYDPEFPPENAEQKRTRLAEELVDAYFSTYTASNTQGKTPELDEIEDFLLEFFEFEYGVQLEDSSEISVAKDVDGLWKECIAKASSSSSANGSSSNGESLLEKFERLAKKARADDADPAKALRGTRTGDQDEEDDDEEYTSDEDGEDEGGEDSMEVDETRTTATSSEPRQREEPQVDDDGFTTVTKSTKGRH
jgi:pre-rRNA-processing protein TSR2